MQSVQEVLARIKLPKWGAFLLTLPLPGVPQLWRGDYLRGALLLGLTVGGYMACSVTGMLFHAIALVDVSITRTGRIIKNSRLRMFAYRAFFVGGFLAMWELSAWEIGPKQWLCVDPFWFGSPVRVLSYLVEITLSGAVFIDTWTTMYEAFLGYIIGAALGVAMGFVLARLETLAEILDPFIVAVNGIPRVAMAPILIIWFGIGVESKIVLAVSLVLFLTFMNTYSGLRGVDPNLKNLSASNGRERDAGSLEGHAARSDALDIDGPQDRRSLRRRRGHPGRVHGGEPGSWLHDSAYEQPVQHRGFVRGPYPAHVHRAHRQLGGELAGALSAALAAQTTGRRRRRDGGVLGFKGSANALPRLRRGWFANHPYRSKAREISS